MPKQPFRPSIPRARGRAIIKALRFALLNDTSLTELQIRDVDYMINVIEEREVTEDSIERIKERNRKANKVDFEPLSDEALVDLLKGHVAE